MIRKFILKSSLFLAKKRFEALKKSVGNLKIDDKATDFDSLKCSLLEKFSSENPHLDLIEIEARLPEFKEGFRS